MSKPALAVAAFEEASRALLEAHVSLLAENAELKLKLAAAIQRLAVHEPDVTEASLVAAPEISVKKGEEETKKKGDDEAKKKAEDKTEGPSKFRAVKDFLFKSKPKTAEDEAKAKSAKTASKDELFVGDQRKKGSSTKNKPDRWVFLRSMEGHTQAVVDMTLCEYDPFLLASASRDGTVRLWHMEGPAALFCGHKGVVNSVRIHPSSQSRLVCTAGQDGTCQIFRIPIFMVHQVTLLQSLSAFLSYLEYFLYSVLRSCWTIMPISPSRLQLQLRMAQTRTRRLPLRRALSFRARECL